MNSSTKRISHALSGWLILSNVSYTTYGQAHQSVSQHDTTTALAIKTRVVTDYNRDDVDRKTNSPNRKSTEGRILKRINNHTVRTHSFSEGVLYKIKDIGRGLKDIWEASKYVKGEGYKESFGIFTSEGLLVLPNKENGEDNPVGSFKFLSSIINEMQSKVIFNGEELEILGIVHTHPDSGGKSEHTPYSQSRFEWNWTKSKIGNYVIAIDGIYHAQPDYLTSDWIGYRKESTYKLIIDKYLKIASSPEN